MPIAVAAAGWSRIFDPLIVMLFTTRNGPLVATPPGPPARRGSVNETRTQGRSRSRDIAADTGVPTSSRPVSGAEGASTIGAASPTIGAGGRASHISQVLRPGALINVQAGHGQLSGATWRGGESSSGAEVRKSHSLHDADALFACSHSGHTQSSPSGLRVKRTIVRRGRVSTDTASTSSWSRSSVVAFWPSKPGALRTLGYLNAER